MIEQPTDAAREERVNEIIAAYLKAVKEGRALDRQKILAQHPDLAAELTSFFADQDQFHAVAGPSGRRTEISRLRDNAVWAVPNKRWVPCRMGGGQRQGSLAAPPGPTRLG
jgi:hypothetical protein